MQDLAAGIGQVQDLRSEGILRKHWEMRGCPRWPGST